MGKDADAYFKAVEAVEAEYQADIFLYNAAIDDYGLSCLVEAVTTVNPRTEYTNCILILVTNGGLANSAYRIARLMQQTYKKFYLFAPSYCKSAGTIIALGANEIIMDMFSELGPLDVQLLDKDEIGSRKSGMLHRSAFESLTQEAFDMFSHTMLSIKGASGGSISFRLAADIAASMTSSLLSPILAQINPDNVGSDFRDLSVATAYGERLAQKSGNPKQGAVDYLVRAYPSHDFIIDREEAEALFHRVSQPKLSLYELVGQISQYTHKPASSPVVMPLARPQEQPAQEGEDAGNATKSNGVQGMDEGRDSDRRGDSGKAARKPAAKPDPQPDSAA
ncbi:MAG: hypothetical protein JJU26_06565 [Oceanicaulis sp.]|nr:hypothetical protein [Oceanicaulis sp.]